MAGAPRIVIADSSAFMRITLSSALENLGYEVLATAGDSGEALDKTLQRSPDILLIDLAMAEPGKFSIIRAIMKENPQVTVVLLVAAAHPDEAEAIVDGVRAGAKGYIKKPLSPNELKEHIKRAQGRA